MAQGRRVERVASLIRREISELLINGIRDERVHLGMVTITEVEVSGDLQHCKVFDHRLMLFCTRFVIWISCLFCT